MRKPRDEANLGKARAREEQLPLAFLPPHRPILIVEDCPALAATFAAAFGREGWGSETARTLAEAWHMVPHRDPRLVLLDRRLPDGDGLDLLRRLAPRRGTGFVVVAGDMEQLDRIVALELGADDVLAKPGSLHELTARVRAVARRLAPEPALAPPADGAPAPGDAVPLGPAVADTRRRRIVGLDGLSVALTEAETRFIAVLAAADGAAVGRDRIAREVLGVRALEPGNRRVDQLAHTVRRKLAAATGGAAAVMSVRNEGYLLAT
jgi:DNA-binding response OmpR family regulator